MLHNNIFKMSGKRPTLSESKLMLMGVPKSKLKDIKVLTLNGIQQGQGIGSIVSGAMKLLGPLAKQYGPMVIKNIIIPLISSGIKSVPEVIKLFQRKPKPILTIPGKKKRRGGGLKLAGQGLEKLPAKEQQRVITLISSLQEAKKRQKGSGIGDLFATIGNIASAFGGISSSDFLPQSKLGIAIALRAIKFLFSPTITKSIKGLLFGSGLGLAGGYKRKKRGKGTSAGAAVSPWMIHVKKYKKAHPEVSHKNALKQAKKSYKKVVKTRGRPRKRR